MKADNELAVIDLLLVYRYTLSLTKNEHMFFKKKQNKTLNKAKLRKQEQNDQNKKKGKNFPPAGVEPQTINM